MESNIREATTRSALLQCRISRSTFSKLLGGKQTVTKWWRWKVFRRDDAEAFGGSPGGQRSSLKDQRISVPQPGSRNRLMGQGLPQRDNH